MRLRLCFTSLEVEASSLGSFVGDTWTRLEALRAAERLFEEADTETDLDFTPDGVESGVPFALEDNSDTRRAVRKGIPRNAQDKT